MFVDNHHTSGYRDGVSLENNICSVLDVRRMEGDAGWW